jgi:hypothetical protein
MMNVVDLAQDKPNSLFKMEVAYRPQLELKDPVWFNLVNRGFNIKPKAGNITRYKLPIKPTAVYLADALNEGLKQNLFGNDINTEFLMLSIRVYLIQIIKFVVSSPKQLATDKYSEKRNGTSNIINNDRSGIPLKFILQ